jgi:8-oxo-dGTP diphosphatase
VADDERLVVGAAILRGGRMLAARRTRPAAAVGRWELPGGKVEPGEDPTAALVREIDEELGCVVEVDSWLPGQTRISDDLVLRIAVAALVSGTPEPREHDAVRWLGSGELDDVDWLDSDRPFLASLRALLVADAARWAHAVFFEEDDAAAVADRLRAAGFEARVARERYAGEDDDEDHPWAVTTDAPLLLLDPLVDEHDGWLDDAERSSSPTTPLDLPAGPKRLHRPT